MAWHGMAEVCEGAPVAVGGWVLAHRHDLAPLGAFQGPPAPPNPGGAAPGGATPSMRPRPGAAPVVCRRGREPGEERRKKKVQI